MKPKVPNFLNQATCIKWH